MANLYSFDGGLHSMFNGPEEPGIPLGQPLVVRYLYFYLRHDRGRQQLMISTHLKTTEEKAGAAEAINYHNPSARFSDGQFRLADFGGRHYGHPLCYYTPSYVGEAIRLTTRIVELDRVDRRVTRALREGLATLGGLPAFAEYLVYTALVGAGVGVAEKLIDFFDRDDRIVDSHSIDLHSGHTAARRLRPGRIVCIPGEEEDEFAGSEAWRLSRDNRLVEGASGREYERGSYFVLEVACERHAAYEKFDHFQRVAELLRKTNRGENPAEVVEFGIEVMRGWRDYGLLDEMERLALEGASSNRERITALYRLLTPRMQTLFGDRLRTLLQQPTR